MRYNHFSMLPSEAFKTEIKGKIKPQGGGDGGGSAPPPPPKYDLYTDPGYISSQNFLDSLKTEMEKNNKKLTPAEIIAALTPNQRDIIAQQNVLSQIPNMSNWFNINQIAPKESLTTIIPTSSPIASGRFSGVQSASPEIISTLNAILGSGLTGGSK